MGTEDYIGLFIIVLCFAWMVFNAISCAKMLSGIPSLRDKRAERKLDVFFLVCLVGIALSGTMAYMHGPFEASVALAFASVFGFVIIYPDTKPEST